MKQIVITLESPEIVEAEKSGDINLIGKVSKSSVQKQILSGLAEMKASKSKAYALIIDRKSLAYALNNDIKNDFLELPVGCASAVMLSDISIAQFRFLEQLLLVHGHWSYRRISSMLVHHFPRNLHTMIGICHFNVFVETLAPAPSYWIVTLFVVVASLIPYFSIKAIQVRFYPGYHGMVQWIRHEGQIDDPKYVNMVRQRSIRRTTVGLAA
ncbi:hypothetical protein L2E82_00104 [Cichorium intybus]|uniref:Uncharacterized protein n=1 Tax=Cichorium intybus TaxID=13427 RepID=A0ACB9GW12_CICIN|nr:hypothetical protein L2E82_00104 [Cichorium intybus]